MESQRLSTGGDPGERVEEGAEQPGRMREEPDVGAERTEHGGTAGDVEPGDAPTGSRRPGNRAPRGSTGRPLRDSSVERRSSIAGTTGD